MSAVTPLVNAARADAFMVEWMTRPGGSSHPVQESFAVLPRASEPALVVTAYFTADALASWVEDVRAFGEIAFDETMPHASLPPAAARIHEAQLRADGVSPVDALAQALGDR